MDSKGALSVRPVRQSRRVAILAGGWLVMILMLVIWWAWHLLDQSRHIAELSSLAGMPPAEIAAESAHRVTLGEALAHVVRPARAGHHLSRFGHHRRIDDAGVHRIDPHLHAGLRAFHRRAFRHQTHRAF